MDKPVVTEEHRRIVVDVSAHQCADWVLEWIRLGDGIGWKSATTEDWNRRALLIAEAEARGEERMRERAADIADDSPDTWHWAIADRIRELPIGENIKSPATPKRSGGGE